MYKTLGANIGVRASQFPMKSAPMRLAPDSDRRSINCYQNQFLKHLSCNLAPMIRPTSFQQNVEIALQVPLLP